MSGSSGQRHCTKASPPPNCTVRCSCSVSGKWQNWQTPSSAIAFFDLIDCGQDPEAGLGERLQRARDHLDHAGCEGALQARVDRVIQAEHLIFLVEASA